MEAGTDRICIQVRSRDRECICNALRSRVAQTNGTKHAYLSAEDVASCCSSCGDGCNGGDPGAAWDYFQSSGIVTGGPYNSNQGCCKLCSLLAAPAACPCADEGCTVPYEVAACDHHVKGNLPPWYGRHVVECRGNMC